MEHASLVYKSSWQGAASEQTCQEEGGYEVHGEEMKHFIGVCCLAVHHRSVVDVDIFDMEVVMCVDLMCKLLLSSDSSILSHPFL